MRTQDGSKQWRPGIDCEVMLLKILTQNIENIQNALYGSGSGGRGGGGNGGRPNEYVCTGEIV